MSPSELARLFKESRILRHPLSFGWARLRLTVAIGVLSAVAPACSGEGFRKERAYEPPSGIYSAVFTPDSRYIVAAGFRQIFLLDVPSGRIVERFPKQDRGDIGASVYGIVAVSSDGRLVASAATGHWEPLRIWGLHTGEMKHPLSVTAFEKELEKPNVHALAFSPDGRELAVGTGLGFDKVTHARRFGKCDVLLFDLAEPTAPPIRLRGHEGPVQAVLYMADGKRLVSASNDHTLRVWDIPTQTELKRLGTPKAPEPHFHVDRRYNSLSLSLSADGKRLAQGYAIWDVEKWEQIPWRKDPIHVSRPAPMDPSAGPPVVSSGVLSALSPDAKWLLTTGRAEHYSAMAMISLWDVSTGKRVAQEQVFSVPAPILACAISPDGRHAMAAGEGEILAGVFPRIPTSDPRKVHLWRMPESPGGK